MPILDQPCQLGSLNLPYRFHLEPLGLILSRSSKVGDPTKQLRGPEHMGLTASPALTCASFLSECCLNLNPLAGTPVPYLPLSLLENGVMFTNSRDPDVIF